MFDSFRKLGLAAALAVAPLTAMAQLGPLTNPEEVTQAQVPTMVSLPARARTQTPM